MSSRNPKAALVTGGGSGIGRAIALALGELGCRVGLVGRTRERLEETAGKLDGRGVVLPADLSRDGDLEHLAEAVDERLPGLDTLVHSAGAFARGPLAEASVAELDYQYRVNARGPLVLTRKLLPSLVRSRGQIVFINSTAGLRSRGGIGHYAASKHALRALAESLRQELAPEGVRVLSLFPGRTATPMQERVHRLEGRSYDPGEWMQPEDVAAMVVRCLTLPSSAQVVELEMLPPR